MAKITHLVIAVNHDTGSVEFDGDGSREWIRRLFEPETNTYDTELEDWVNAPEEEQKAIDLLSKLIKVSVTDYLHWQER